MSIGEIDVRTLGAVGDGASHPLSNYFATLAAAQAVYPHATSLTNEIDWAAIQGAVNLAALPVPTSALPNVRGATISVPKGLFLCDQPLQIVPTARFVLLRGVGSQGYPSIDIGSGSTIVYTGSGVRFIDARSTLGLTLEHLTVAYDNEGFAGLVVDFSHAEGNDSDTTRNVIRNCTITGIGNAYGARALVSLFQAICCVIDGCVFGLAQSAIRLREVVLGGIPSYSNAHVVSNSLFIFHRWSLVNAGEGLSVTGCNFEGTDGAVTLEHAYYDDIPITQGSATCTLTFSGNTITRSSGSWLDDGWEVGLPFTAGYANYNSGPGYVTAITATVLTTDRTYTPEPPSSIAFLMYVQIADSVSISGCWMGDLSAEHDWLVFRQVVFGLNIQGNFISGAGKHGIFLGYGGFGGVHIAGNHFSVAEEAISVGTGSSGYIAVLGNQVTNGLIRSENELTSLFMAGNDALEESAASTIDSRLQVLTRGIAAIPTTAASFGLRVAQGSAASVGVGSDATSTYIQSFGAPLQVNAGGQDTVFNRDSAGKVGIGRAPTDSTLEVAGDIETIATKGVVLRSPDGTRYRIVVANGGALSATAL